MANHVIRDRIWESNKLRRCSRDAALAYPWVFLIADDHGRFEYNPRRIWSKVFGNRDDIGMEEVAVWLDEYWAVGLLTRYHLDGDLAFWTRFVGRKKSERRDSEYPDPNGMKEFCHPRRSAAVGGKSTLEIETETETDQIRDGSDARTRKRRRSREDESLDRDDTRSLIDAYNSVFGGCRPITYTPGNLRAAARALDEGYTEEQCRVVFEAVRDGSTETAAWCKTNNREFEYLVRPPYKHHRTHDLTYGPLDKIPNELATGRKAG